MVLESSVVLVGSFITWVKPYISRTRSRFLVSLLLSHRKSQFVSPIIIDSFLSASVALIRASIRSKYSTGFWGGLYNDVTKKDLKFPTLTSAEIDSINQNQDRLSICNSGFREYTSLLHLKIYLDLCV